MHNKLLIFFAWCLLLCVGVEAANQPLLLRDNLAKANPGDYLVTAQGKNYSVLIIRSREADYLNIEEITIPSSRLPFKSDKTPFSWRNWITSGAIGHTCRLIYPVHLPIGTIKQAYSVSRGEWVSIPTLQNFLSILLSLTLNPIPDVERKRIGPPPSADSPDRRPLWQPQLIMDGKIIPHVIFKGWRTVWPKDGGELSGKTIEIFLPQDSEQYPSYFPYWLQVHGWLGKAKVRIVDSGSLPNQ